MPTEERIHDPEFYEERRLPDHNTAVTNNGKLSRSKGNDGDDGESDSGDDVLVNINVRELQRDPLNAFDRNPDLMADLVGEIMANKTFQLRDGVAAPLGARLANVMPGLFRPKRSSFASRSPSGINWVEAGECIMA